MTPFPDGPQILSGLDGRSDGARYDEDHVAELGPCPTCEAPADWDARLDGSLGGPPGVLERIACELVRILERERTQRVIHEDEHYERKAEVMRMLSDHLATARIEAEMEACSECLGTGEIGFGNDPAAWRRCPACEERQHALEMIREEES